MSDTGYESISFCCKEKCATAKFRVEGKTDINTETVGKVVSLSAVPFITGKKAEKGYISFWGKIVFYAGYKDADGMIKKAECVTDINEKIACEKADENSTAYLSCSVEKTETDTSGINLSFSASVTVKADLYNYGEFACLTDKDGVFFNRTQKETVKRFKVKTGVYPVEEEFELDYAVREVLSQKAKAVITAVQCGMGAIIVDGEVFLSALLLQSGDKKGIIRENKTLPFRAEIDYEEALPAYDAVARVTERSFKTDIDVSDEENKSTVRASVILGLSGEAFLRQETAFATDAFCEDKETELIFDTACIDEPLALHSFTEKISATVNKGDIKGNIIATDNESVEIISVSAQKDYLKTEGVLSLSCICLNEGEISSFKVSVPFENTLKDLPANCEFDIFATVKEPYVKTDTGDDAVIEADIVYTVYPTKNTNLKYLKDIRFTGEKEICDSAISVYIAAENEELFPLAKRLSVSPEQLVAVNPELEFPLSGKERIVIYRRKI